MPVSPDYEWPSCWIRGEMRPIDIEGDKVRQTVQNCKWRKFKSIHMFIGADHVCTHPAIGPKEDVEGAKTLGNGAVVAGGLSDSFATFCEAVDLHLTSLGEESRLIIDVESHDSNPPLLGSGE